MEKLLIIDGSNLLFQMFYGMPSRIVNKDGKAIQGTLGFVGALIKIIKMISPTHLVVLFDGEHENKRTELLDVYKSNRIDYSEVEEENNPFSQINDVYSTLSFIGIRYIETTDFETDDVISSYVHTYGDMHIVISSFDSDFFQLIGDNVKVLRYRGAKTVICDTRYIKDKYGILPFQYADFKSLTGDTADNIKGAERIGPKTASALINQFGCLEDIVANAECITKPSVKESVIKNIDRLRLNYKLIKLDDRAIIPFDLSELKYEYNGITTSEVLKGIGLQ